MITQPYWCVLTYGDIWVTLSYRYYDTYTSIYYGYYAGVWTLYTTSGYLLGVLLVEQGGYLRQNIIR